MAKRIHILLWLFFASCFGTQDISNTNLSSAYRASDKLFHPEITSYRFTADSVRFFVKLNTRELLFVNQGQNEFAATLKIVCRLLDSYESPVALDTVTRLFGVPKTAEENNWKVFTLDMRIPKEQVYLAEITLMDAKKNTNDIFFTGLDFLTDKSRQSFLVSKAGLNIPLFQNYISATDTVRVSYFDSSVKKIYVKFYRRDFPLAAPPFSFDVSNPFNYKYDSLFTIAPGRSLVLPSEGFYQLLIDTMRTEGFTLFRFTKGFPAVTSPARMIEAVRYLTSKREFDELKASPDPKTAIDKFWVNAGNNQDRTRNLIKKYYGRVQEANRLFSSFTEGWRTDRGMIYVVFGAPHIVYRNSVNESWVYGQSGNPISLNFSFNKVNNPFTDNDYTLSRAPIYESNWHQAVDVWRQGRVYNDFN